MRIVSLNYLGFLHMSNSVETSTSRTSSVHNQNILELMEHFRERQNCTQKVCYDVFKLISIAFLKENNEVIGTLHINEEFRDELFNFVDSLTHSSDTNIDTLLKQYAGT